MAILQNQLNPLPFRIGLNQPGEQVVRHVDAGFLGELLGEGIVRQFQGQNGIQ
jgi:hypothetical protein